MQRKKAISNKFFPGEGTHKGNILILEGMWSYDPDNIWHWAVTGLELAYISLLLYGY